LRLLLDTHIAIWAISAPDRLSPDVQAAIIDPDNDILVSVVALWEIAIKGSTSPRRGTDAMVPLAMASAEFQETGFSLLPIAIAHLLPVETMPFHHRDPFDRLMVAQARVEGLTFVTSDRALGVYGSHVMLV
jgi:PIN domain nuclease of toxin-antitoxin system